MTDPAASATPSPTVTPTAPTSSSAAADAAPAYDPSAKHKGAGKTSRIPIKVVPASEVLRKPPWIRVRAATSTSRFTEIKQILREHRLHTVCEEASCPNIGECFGNGTATFMIMGQVHTALPLLRCRPRPSRPARCRGAR